MKDGGSAFPGVYWDQDSTGQYVPRESEVGMTLRDWFAGQALTGLLGVLDGRMLQRVTEKDAADFAPAFSLSAYAVADAMLKARETP